MRSLSVPAVCLLVACGILSLPVAVRADGGAMEPTKSLYVTAEKTSTGSRFIVHKSASNDTLEKSFISQKADFSYVISLWAIDNSMRDEDKMASYNGSGTIPAGKASVVIIADKYEKELEPQLVTTGRVEIVVTAPENSDYRSTGQNSVEVVKKEYREEMIKTAQEDPGFMQSFMDDYQKFAVEHQEIPPEELNGEFIKKYPKYKKIMPQ